MAICLCIHTRSQFAPGVAVPTTFPAPFISRTSKHSFILPLFYQLGRVAERLKYKIKPPVCVFTGGGERGRRATDAVSTRQHMAAFSNAIDKIPFI